MSELPSNELPGRRALICELTERGLAPKEVEKQARCGPTARRKALRRYKALGTHNDAPRSGMPPKHTKRDERELVRLIVTGKARTGVEASAIYNQDRPPKEHLAESTVSAILAKNGLPGISKSRTGPTRFRVKAAAEH